MKRDIIRIDEELCNGCGQCVPNCHEGALQVIDDKVRLVSELMCDGLGACIGHCPEGAITIETREAEPYNEMEVIGKMKDKGMNTVVAHLRHLKEHGETGYLKEGVTYLKMNVNDLRFDLQEVLSRVHNHNGSDAISTPEFEHTVLHNHGAGGCPGSRAMVIEKETGKISDDTGADQPSQLRQWPVQMHLLNPEASYLRGADLLLAADCVAYSMGNFHSKYLRGKSLAIACPKLDHATDIYVDKLKTMIDRAKVNTITVMMMEVPCCGGLLQMVKTASDSASRRVPVKQMICSISGELLDEEWI
jgi:NAD-dependent dihydropyrimidine dehydrogenase PreA subunit